MKISIASFVLISYPAVTYSTLVVQPGGTALELARAIAGVGVTVTDAAFINCDDDQVGTFTNGEFDIDMKSGIVLSSAYAREAEGPNNDNYPYGDALGRPGSALLDKILQPKGRYTKDACTLYVEFDCQDREEFELKYVFGSDNYPSEGYNPNEDLMGVFLNGETTNHNVATLNGTYISVNTLYRGTYFKDNKQDTYDCEMNGFSTPLKTHDKVPRLAKEGSNEIYIVVADGYRNGAVNNRKGSWLFVEQNSLKCRSGNRGRPRMAPRLCARKVKNQCKCRDWKCIDKHIRKTCRAEGSSRAVIDYFAAVRNIFRSRLC